MVYTKEHSDTIPPQHSSNSAMDHSPIPNPRYKPLSNEAAERQLKFEKAILILRGFVVDQVNNTVEIWAEAPRGGRIPGPLWVVGSNQPADFYMLPREGSELQTEQLERAGCLPVEETDMVDIKLLCRADLSKIAEIVAEIIAEEGIDDLTPLKLLTNERVIGVLKR